MGCAFVLMVSILAAYLLGSIPSSFILTKLFKGVDIRQHGSGNVGATNALRVAGKLPALIALIIDISKGIIAVTLLASLSYPYVSGIDYEFYRILLGFSAIVGHIWTVFLNFKGGKGVATTIGVLATLGPGIFLPSLFVWILIFSITHYVSVASIAFGVALSIFSVVFNKSIYMTIFAVTLCFISIYKHKDNIKRLVRQEETKTYIFKRKVKN